MLHMYRAAPEPQYTVLREPVEGEVPEFVVMEIQLTVIVSDTVCMRTYIHVHNHTHTHTHTVFIKAHISGGR